MLSYPSFSFDLWQSIDDPAARIDRALQDRSHRLIMGVAVNRSVRKLQCVLTMTEGHGKFLRLRHVVGEDFDIPPAIIDSYQSLNQSGADLRLKDFRQFVSEMADFQSQAIETVKRHAGKYVDRILAVAVTDPGFWVEEFDGSRIYSALSDSQRIADLTGLTVIDNFPVNDVLSGGSGQPLSPLPLWLAFADRHNHVSSEHRIVIFVDQNVQAFLLPASDGLDAELPPIQMVRSPCGDARRFVQALDEALQVLQRQVNLRLRSGAPLAVGQVFVFGNVQQDTDLVRHLGPELAKRSVTPIDTVNNEDRAGTFVIDNGTLQGVIAGLLGILHVDQMHANLPWLTGALQQRVLGRVTPGTPSNWRQLVREMSDFSPPAMKLKDAV